MKTVYIPPRAQVISFAPDRAIAVEEPDWGWEEDVFSTPEARNAGDGERRGRDED